MKVLFVLPQIPFPPHSGGRIVTWNTVKRFAAECSVRVACLYHHPSELPALVEVKKYVEEVGTSNIFFVIGDELITPPLGGSILPGVTRNSVITLARYLGTNVVERPISIEEVIKTSENGSLKEAFASGTAAVISPVGNIYFRDKEYAINGGKTGALAEKLYNEILKIQYGMVEDPFGWRIKIANGKKRSR